MPLKQQLVRVGLAFFVGVIPGAYLLWSSFGYMGHGRPDSSNWLLLGPGGFSLFLFPLVCAAAASKWLPGIIAALIWEVLHHLTVLKRLFTSSPGDFGASLPLSLLMYLTAHLTVTAVLIFACVRWADARHQTEPKVTSSYTFKPRD